MLTDQHFPDTQHKAQKTLYRIKVGKLYAWRGSSPGVLCLSTSIRKDRIFFPADELKALRRMFPDLDFHVEAQTVITTERIRVERVKE